MQVQKLKTDDKLSLKKIVVATIAKVFSKLDVMSCCCWCCTRGKESLVSPQNLSHSTMPSPILLYIVLLVTIAKVFTLTVDPWMSCRWKVCWSAQWSPLKTPLTLSLAPILWRPVSAENTLHSLRPPSSFPCIFHLHFPTFSLLQTLSLSVLPMFRHFTAPSLAPHQRPCRQLAAHWRHRWREGGGEGGGGGGGEGTWLELVVVVVEGPTQGGARDPAHTHPLWRSDSLQYNTVAQIGIPQIKNTNTNTNTNTNRYTNTNTHPLCSDSPCNTTLPPSSWMDCCRSNTKKDKIPIRLKHKCWKDIARGLRKHSNFVRRYSTIPDSFDRQAPLQQYHWWWHIWKCSLPESKPHSIRNSTGQAVSQVTPTYIAYPSLYTVVATLNS